MNWARLVYRQMIKKIVIKSGCIACKNCERICPAIFKVKWISTVICREYDQNCAKIMKAVEACPVKVINIEQVEDSKLEHSDFSPIRCTQRVLLIASLMMPLQFVFPESKYLIWNIWHFALIFLMIIRPLRDLLPSVTWLSNLIPLRKELWILSVSIVVSAWIINYTSHWNAFLNIYFSYDYWSNNGLWAHIWELCWLILLITSNTFSQNLLWPNWKRIQKLSYLYSFAWLYYIWSAFSLTIWIIGVILISTLTLLAFIKNKYA